ncbi:MAG TPA: LytR C-terminal domain-containing protein [Sphingomicrobium sp.]|nr:LytR C-terminal domain-containing protein [Sphingomicrobium sp.]
MMRGGKFLLLSGCLAVTGCVTHTVQVRAIADPNGKLHYGGDLLADARAQLAMGAVGLAIESFRTLQREQPDSAEAYAGLAASYAAMGRYDLTRTNYELALAYAPNDRGLLQALASTLDKLGETEQAAQVRSEVRIAAARTAQPNLVPAPITPLGVPRATSMTVKLPGISHGSAIAQTSGPPIARPRLGVSKVDLSTKRLSSISKPALAPNAQIVLPLIEDSLNALLLAQAPVEGPINSRVLRAAKVDLQAARASFVSQRGLTVNNAIAVNQVAPAELGSSPTRAVSVARASPIRKPQMEGDFGAPEHGPHLERTSLGEVALITVAHAPNRPTLRFRALQLPGMAVSEASPTARPPRQTASQSLLAAALVRWVPLRFASQPQNIQLLNAARTDGLAARTRVALADRGWRKVRIGNALAVRQHSVVLYAAGRWEVAAKLAAQLRCKAVRVTSLKNVVVLLGRDAALQRGSTLRA